MSATIVHPQTADSVLVLERVSSTATLSSTTANYVPSNSQIVQPTDEAFMKEAIDLSIHSVKMGGGPFGAVIVDGNNTVVGRGHNQVTLNNDPTAHAEVVAIRDACTNVKSFKLDNCKLYTSCEPCPMCLSAIYWSRITKVYYGNTRKCAKHIGFDDDFIYDEVSKPIDDREIPMISCSPDEAKKGFLEWTMKNDKTEY